MVFLMRDLKMTELQYVGDRNGTGIALTSLRNDIADIWSSVPNPSDIRELISNLTVVEGANGFFSDDSGRN